MDGLEVYTLCFSGWAWTGVDDGYHTVGTILAVQRGFCGAIEGGAVLLNAIRTVFCIDV